MTTPVDPEGPEPPESARDEFQAEAEPLIGEGNEPGGDAADLDLPTTDETDPVPPTR